MEAKPFLTLVWDDDRLVPDAILPVQLIPRAERRSPELALLRGVLAQAVIDLHRFEHPRYPWTRNLYRDAYSWISSTSRSHLFTFVNVCEALGLSPPAVRARLLSDVRRPAMIDVEAA